jgi:hypothetical protein
MLSDPRWLDRTSAWSAKADRNQLLGSGDAAVTVAALILTSTRSRPAPVPGGVSQSREQTVNILCFWPPCY